MKGEHVKNFIQDLFYDYVTVIFIKNPCYTCLVAPSCTTCCNICETTRNYICKKDIESKQANALFAWSFVILFIIVVSISLYIS